MGIAEAVAEAVVEAVAVAVDVDTDVTPLDAEPVAVMVLEEEAVRLAAAVTENGKQVVAPGALVNPKPQSVQEAPAVVAWYEPARHGVGAPEPAGPKWPTGHAVCILLVEPAGQK